MWLLGIKCIVGTQNKIGLVKIILQVPTQNKIGLVVLLNWVDALFYIGGVVK